MRSGPGPLPHSVMKVLLARPHDFLVDKVRSVLERLHLEPVVLQSVRELATLPGQEFVGVVISLAPTSSVRESVADVHRAVRARWARRPIVFTGLSSLASAQRGLRTEVPGVELAGPGDLAPGAALYLTEADLGTGRDRSVTALAGRLHVPLPHA